MQGEPRVPVCSHLPAEAGRLPQAPELARTPQVLLPEAIQVAMPRDPQRWQASPKGLVLASPSCPPRRICGQESYRAFLSGQHASWTPACGCPVITDVSPLHSRPHPAAPAPSLANHRAQTLPTGRLLCFQGPPLGSQAMFLNTLIQAAGQICSLQSSAQSPAARASRPGS